MMPLSSSKHRATAMTPAERLAKENKQMEERLKQLKAAMSKKKAQRQTQGGVIWRSGGQGALKQHVVNILDQNSSPRPKQKHKGIERKEASKSKTKTVLDVLPGPADESEVETSGSSGSLWMPSAAAVQSTSATEDAYDERASHASFLEALHEWRGTVAKETAVTSNTTTKENVASSGGSLLDGPVYDEQANALEFQKALSDWRLSQKQAEPSPVDVAAVSVGSAQTETIPRAAKAVEIEFNSTSKLSYMERLMLKQSRKRPISRDTNVLRETNATNERVCGSLDIEEEVLSYRVDEPDDTSSSQNNILAKPKNSGWTLTSSTPEYSSDDLTDSPDIRMSNVSEPRIIYTPIESDTDDSDMRRQEVELKVDAQSRPTTSLDRITPSLMNDFEEMENSFTR